LEFLSEYDFDINHIKGKENKVVDALNRRVHEMHAIAISMYKSVLKDKILEAAKSDQKYMEIKKKLQQGILQHQIEDYKLREILARYEEIGG
jgi:galactokinase/mevalonate kinase-like predicted kinase